MVTLSQKFSVDNVLFSDQITVLFCHSNIVYHVTLVQSQFLGYIVTRLTKKAW